MRPYHAGGAPAALAACPSSSRVQGCVPGTPVAGWSADDIQLVTDSDRRQLRSPLPGHASSHGHNNFDDRSFGAAGPRMWNSLPPHLRRDMNFARFKRQLKTFIFGS